MEAKDSASESYAWKIILKGREVIKMGSRFQVGNGKNIKIWQHHWLPIKHPPLVTSPIIESMEDATVDCLIDENTGKWDAEMLEGILVPAEAAIAKKIPLARSPTEDSLFWPFTANGQYTCKSGYRLLKDLEAEAEDDSQPDMDRNFWKCIWSLEVPNKYKNMVWRACRNSLPTKLNLTRRTIIDNLTCDRCSSNIEDSLHAQWVCLGLDEVWDGDRWSFRTREVSEDFKHLCRWIIENEKSPEHFTIQVWRIWNQRNKSRLQQPCCLTKDLKQAAQECWDEIRATNPMPNPIRPQPIPKWTAPLPDIYKINYDGAISSADNKSRVGVVIRDCKGEVIASLIQQLEQAYQPVEVEAIAACRAVEFGSEIGVNCAIMEGDSKVIVKALRNKDNGLLSFAPLINDVSLFSSLYSELSYSHIRRDGNKVAHSLAKLTLITPNCTVWKKMFHLALYLLFRLIWLHFNFIK